MRDREKRGIVEKEPPRTDDGMRKRRQEAGLNGKRWRGREEQRDFVLWGAVKARGPCHDDLSIKQT